MKDSGSGLILAVIAVLLLALAVYGVERYRAHCERESSSVGCYFSELDK
jgi:hypothetical protein